MKFFIKKIAITILVITLTIFAFSLSNNNVRAEDTQYIKVSVEDYSKHKNEYVSTENKIYILCGEIDRIYLAFYNQNVYAFKLKSFNTINLSTVEVLVKRDNLQGGSTYTFDGHAFSSALEENEGKYVELRLDNSRFSEIEGDYTRGYVYSDPIDSNITNSDIIDSYIEEYKTNKVYSSMRFDYDPYRGVTQNSCCVYERVTSLDQIDVTGTYTFCKINSDGNAVQFPVEPKNYTAGDEFPYSIEILSDNKFKCVYPDKYPEEFKLSYQYQGYTDKLNISYGGNVIITDAKYKEDISRLDKTIQIKDGDEVDTLYLFKRLDDSADYPNKIKYDPKSVAVKFLTYIDGDASDAISSSKLVKSVTYGVKLSIEGKDDKFINFDSSELSRVETATSNTSVLEGGVLRGVLNVKGIPMSSWDTNITVTPYIKVVFTYTTPTTDAVTFESEATIYQESITRTVSSLALDYYLNHSTESGVIAHLVALKQVAEKTAEIREAE